MFEIPKRTIFSHLTLHKGSDCNVIPNSCLRAILVKTKCRTQEPYIALKGKKVIEKLFHAKNCKLLQTSLLDGPRTHYFLGESFG